MNKLFVLIVLVLFSGRVSAQDTSKRKTIDITSSFKPVLRTPSKLNFTPSAATGDTTRPSLQYNVPVQNLAFGFSPAPLKPLAYDDSLQMISKEKIYIKLGFGNFTTPYAKAALAFGDGVKTNGSLEGDYTSSKGNLPYQKFSQYGIRGSAIVNLNESNDLRFHAGIQGYGTYRYGFQPDTLTFPKDSLQLNFTDFSAGASLSNKKDIEAPVWYEPTVAFHLFGDNNRGREMQFNFNLPFEKNLTDNIGVQLGVGGMISNFKSDSANFNNNYFLVNVGVNTNINNNIKLHAGAIPSWNNKQFKLLPDVQADFLINGSSFIFQAGWKGYFTEQTYRSLVAFNPWIRQPDSLTNTRNTEFFGAVKAVVDEHFSFRIKAGYSALANVPLFVNDIGDGKTYRLLTEASMNKTNISGELSWLIGQKFQWYNSLSLSKYGGIDVAPKAYGLLPFEFRSSARARLVKDLYLKADLYNFAATWYAPKAGGTSRSGSGFDLNAGAEFKVISKIDIWIQFNNILNQHYQRWNQYPVLGFQAIGGVIFHL
jgi:hypothetical protein